VNRNTYTKIFLKQANVALTEENISASMRVWWQNNRTKSEGGLRLTEQGLDFLRTTLDLAVYEVPFPTGFDLKPQVIIFLDRFIDCPYFLTDRSITVLSERKCFELYLFNGDVQKYGVTKAMSRKKATEENN
jgi:hypothetical protein